MSRQRKKRVKSFDKLRLTTNLTCCWWIGATFARPVGLRADSLGSRHSRGTVGVFVRNDKTKFDNLPCVIFLFTFFCFLAVVITSRPFRIPFGMAPEVQLELGHASAYTRLDNPVTNDCRFALRLLDAVVTQTGGTGNVFLSPFSILTAVTALTEGANGTTASELLSVVNRSASNLSTQRSRTHQTLLQMNQSSGHYALSVANALYVQKGFKVLPNFLATMRNIYRMGMAALDFAQPDAKPSSPENIINGWVDHVTNHNIPTLIPPGTLGPLTKLVLVNAIYFKGDWETTFDERQTRLRPFFVGKNKFVSVPTMTMKGDFPYRDFPKLGFEMLELPYSGGDVSMFVILPKDDQNVQAVTRRLLHRPYLLSDPSRRLYSTEISVFLPKFRLEESVDLKSTLVAMGARKVFQQGRADLSGITGDQELYVSNAFHQAVVEVNEKGTKAAAATGFVIMGRSMSIDPVFRVDRPFLFFIRHNPTASILFLGRVAQLKDATPNTDGGL